MLYDEHATLTVINALLLPEPNRWFGTLCRLNCDNATHSNNLNGVQIPIFRLWNHGAL